MTSSEPPLAGFRFAWRGRTFDYCDHPYNQTAANERTVEVPIANWWVDHQSGEGCEFGCVLPHYRDDCTWRVIDLADATRPAEAVDVFAVTDRFDWIVSVSTVEHVRWDEWAWLGLPVGEWPRNPHGAWDALSHLYYGMLRPGGRLLVTVPLGAHPFLDARLQGYPPSGLRSRAVASVLARDVGQREWREEPPTFWAPYADRRARAVWVGEFTRDREEPER